MLRWQDAEKLLVEEAGHDLLACGEVHPALFVFRGEEPLFACWLRPFAKGAYADPLIEVLALALPLEADRLALSMAGRAWSFQDPIPPVSADADLRQRVLVVWLVDAVGDSPRTDGVVYPFDLDGDALAWHEPQRVGPGEGWVPQALSLAVEHRAQLRTGVGAIRRQAVRLRRLGHEVWLAPEVAQRLRLRHRAAASGLSGGTRGRRAR